MPEYLVTLAVRVIAEDPNGAPVSMIGHLVENGLTDWAYQVIDPDTDDVLGLFNGYGIVVPVGNDTDPGDDESDQEQTPVQTDPDEKPSDFGGQEVTDEESDAALLSLATDLNKADDDKPATE